MSNDHDAQIAAAIIVAPVELVHKYHIKSAMLISMGYSIKVIQGVLGHTDYNTTANIDGYLSQKMKTEAFNSIAEVLEN